MQDSNPSDDQLAVGRRVRPRTAWSDSLQGGAPSLSPPVAAAASSRLVQGGWNARSSLPSYRRGPASLPTWLQSAAASDSDATTLRASASPSLSAGQFAALPSYGRRPSRPPSWLQIQTPAQSNTVASVAIDVRPLPAAATARSSSVALSRPSESLAPASSVSASVDARQSRLVDVWVQRSLEIGGDFVLSLPASSRDQHLAVLFSSRQAATLSRHLGGWSTWHTFATVAGISLIAPGEQALADFVASLVDGMRQDRGNRGARSAGASSTVTAMRFVAGLLRLSELASSLASPLIQAWLQRNALNSRSRALGRREAVPLPLHAVLALEQAFVDAADDEAYVIGCILLMIWASLRFSDMQRVHLREAILDGNDHAGLELAHQDLAHRHAMGAAGVWLPGL